MAVRFSRTLTYIINDVICGQQSVPDNRFALDSLFTAILSNKNSYGSLILHTLLKDWEIDRIKTSIEKHQTKNKSGKKVKYNITELRDYLVERLAVAFGENIPHTLNSGHVMFVLLWDRRLFSARLLSMYAVAPLKFLQQLGTLPVSEDRNKVDKSS